MDEQSDPSRRSKYQGTIQILRYNRAKYIGALFMVMMCAAALQFGLNAFLNTGIHILLWCVVFWSVSSLAASHWVYDRSELYRWQWLGKTLTERGFIWANIHAGLDESTPALEALFPGADNIVLDIYDPVEMTEPAILEARTGRTTKSIPANFQELPVGTESMQVVFLLFAAHELRLASSRERFFGELRRILKQNGKLVLVEHLRDWKNVLAFGPGAFHFYSLKEWLRLAEGQNLAVKECFGMTPFVHVFVFQKIS